MASEVAGLVMVLTEGWPGVNQQVVHLFLEREEVMRLWDAVDEYGYAFEYAADDYGFKGLYDFTMTQYVVRFNGWGKVVLTGVLYLVVKAVPRVRVGVTTGWLAGSGRESPADNDDDDARGEHKQVPSAFGPSS